MLLFCPISYEFISYPLMIIGKEAYLEQTTNNVQN